MFLTILTSCLLGNAHNMKQSTLFCKANAWGTYKPFVAFKAIVMRGSKYARLCTAPRHSSHSNHGTEMTLHPNISRWRLFMAVWPNGRVLLVFLVKWLGPSASTATRCCGSPMSTMYPEEPSSYDASHLSKTWLIASSMPQVRRW